MESLRQETATAVLALRHLVEAIAAVREDGADFLDAVTHGGLRIVLDEPTRTLSIGLAPEDGPIEWLETVSIDLSREQAFGRLASSTAHRAHAYTNVSATRH